jgi:hypothetical protein
LSLPQKKKKKVVDSDGEEEEEEVRFSLRVHTSGIFNIAQ